jgi:ATP-dependent DNA helicase RecG
VMSWGYPQETVHAAVVSAVLHRDYSPYVRGSYIQVRLFADRLEVQSSGGLYGNVTEENLEEEHSTRNRLLMRMREDAHLVENRGSGIKTMMEAMRQANLEPPRFQDKRSSFWVTFRNHMLMSPEATHRNRCPAPWNCPNCLSQKDVNTASIPWP